MNKIEQLTCKNSFLSANNTKMWNHNSCHLGSDNAIPGGVGSWALDPFGPGERVTLGRGLVNQLVAPLVEVSGPFFVA